MNKAILFALILFLPDCATEINGERIDVPLPSDRQGTTAIVGGKEYHLPVTVSFRCNTGGGNLTYCDRNLVRLQRWFINPYAHAISLQT